MRLEDEVPPDQRAYQIHYEILDYDSTLELVDPKGETAIFKRRQRVKFLQDNIIAFQDYAWGDGEIFAEYKPGGLGKRMTLRYLINF